MARYRDRLSGPLRDRLDLTVEVPALPPDLLGTAIGGEASASVRERVIAARASQNERYRPAGLRTNAELTPSLMPTHCSLDAAGKRLLDRSVRKMALSARGYDRVLKVARTIADLAGAGAIATVSCTATTSRRAPCSDANANLVDVV